MKRTYPLFPWYFGVLAALLGSAWFSWGPAWGGVSEPPKVQLQEAYGKLPLHFIHNQGQVDARVQFYTQGGGGAFFFTREGVALSLARDAGKSNENRTPGQRTPLPRQGPRAVVQLQPVGMRPGVAVVGADPQAGKVNYFIGNDPKKWRTNLATYGAVVYREAYPGIDLKFYGNGRQLEYDLIVRPGADLSRATFRYQGIKGLTITPGGDLAVQLPDGGSLMQKKPVVYQEIAGRRVAREGQFKILENPAPNTYGFEVASYDPRYPLVIDPTLEYATYLGGSFWDVGCGIAVDAVGCAYVTGYTYSIYPPADPPSNADYWYKLFPGLSGVPIPAAATSIIFVTKLSADGTSREYSTFLGGGTNDELFNDDSYGYAIAVDAAAAPCAYVTGGTMSVNFPLKNPYQSTYGGGPWDVIVCKLDGDGVLIYSTFLGGSGLDIGRGIAVQGNDVYVTGKTFSTNFPSANQASGGGGDAFVARLHYDEDATPKLSMVYSTYLGGNGDDAGNGIAVDGAGNAYVAGATNSKNFPATYKAGRTGDYDAFVARFGPTGARQYSVCLGGAKYDCGEAVAVDGSHNAYVTGYTYSTDFPSTGTLQAARAAATQTTGGGSTKLAAASKGGGSQPSTDAFVTKINAGGNGLGYSVRLGGGSNDYGYGIAVDTSGCAYVTGGTLSADFPADLPPNRQRGGRDAFVTKLDSWGTGALFSTYLSGNDDEEGFAIAVDGSGNACVTGYTYSTDFSTPGAFQPTLNQQGSGDPPNDRYDAFVAKISGP